MCSHCKPLVVTQMADANPSLSDDTAEVQTKIGELEETIRLADEEMKAEGVKTYDRLAALKPKEDLLVKLREKDVKLQEKDNLLLQQQLRTQEGIHAPSVPCQPFVSLCAILYNVLVADV